VLFRSPCGVNVQALSAVFADSGGLAPCMMEQTVTGRRGLAVSMIVSRQYYASPS
jgi:hypothetical protein